MRFDLDQMPITDAHCHGARLEDLLAGPTTGWADRITLLGMCMASSSTADPALKAQVSAFTDGTIFALAARRWLAEWLDVEVADLDATRMKRLTEDAPGYLAGLMNDQKVEDLLVDDGYPQPPVAGSDFATLTGTRVHRVARIEPMIDRLAPTVTNAAELEEAFVAELEDCGTDATCVAYKSVIAYRSGLDVGDPSDDDVAASFRVWRTSGFAGGRTDSKPIRDRLLHVTCRVAAAQDRAVHIHSGAGDPDVLLDHAHPTGLASLVASHPRTGVVLIHSGFPWINEAAYIAGMYANVHLDLSLFTPWATLDIAQGLATVLGQVPTSKVMYGSDQASEPEVMWISARIFRPALASVLSDAVDADLLTTLEAGVMGEGILAGNALRLHGLST